MMSHGPNRPPQQSARWSGCLMFVLPVLGWAGGSLLAAVVVTLAYRAGSPHGGGFGVLRLWVHDMICWGIPGGLLGAYAGYCLAKYIRGS